MAFLCPVRMRRDKKKVERDLPVPVGMGRITGSSSIETLVRVGIEKEHGLSPDSKMVVLHDFTPCVDDELEVKRGQIVNLLYRENDWVYVIGHETRQEGFIPYSYCAPAHTQLADLAVKKKLPREQNVNTDHGENIPLLSAESKLELLEDSGPTLKTNETLILEPECTPFHKEASGRYIVLYTFIARDENDLSVERGEFVTVLNRDDTDWFWIVRSDGEEGFIPAAFVYPADSVLQVQQNMVMQENAHHNTKLNTEHNKHNANVVVNSNIHGGHAQSFKNTNNPLDPTNGLSSLQQQLIQQNQNNHQHQPQIGIGADDLRYGTELVMLYDYKAQAPDDLSVRRGDWIYADLSNQTVDGWLWAYAPKIRKYGFIPKAYARPPAMTSL